VPYLQILLIIHFRFYLRKFWSLLGCLKPINELRLNIKKNYFTSQFSFELIFGKDKN